ncbi:MAG: hypothetical protein LBM61_05480 [Prevotellaceae bacterium]|jgi:hypothetical protein|nr:hypothetical protein [Prevotellaceae bacterium]
MDNKDVDKLIEEVLHREGELPVGLTERLERHIDVVAATEKKRSLRRYSFYLWLGGIAATLLVGVVIIDLRRPARRADTFTDPREAAIALNQAFALVSGTLEQADSLIMLPAHYLDVDKYMESVTHK